MSDHIAEFNMLKKILERARIEVRLLTEEECQPPLEIFRIIGVSQLGKSADIKEKQVYRVISPFRQRFVVMRMPDDKRILLIGPYMTDIPTSDEVDNIRQQLGMSQEDAGIITSTFPDIPKVQGANLLYAVMAAFAESLWPGEELEMVEAGTETADIATALQQLSASSELETKKLYEYKKEKISERYQSENTMMRTVTTGQVEAARHVSDHITLDSFDKRSVNPVRNAKNYCIIMNTLLRKAAEQGGVHPIHLDTLSSSYAFKIEEASTTEAILKMMHVMPSDYASLVREYSYAKYSEPIQKVLVTIDCNLSKNLSLEFLADMASLSENYLSARFKKEVGITISDYITGERIRYACKLLSHENRSIQEAAIESGFSDVHYFTRVFHKRTGLTPGEFLTKSKGKR